MIVKQKKNGCVLPKWSDDDSSSRHIPNEKNVILLILFLLCNCSVIPWYNPYHELPQGGVRPKYPRFKYAKQPYQLLNVSLIDTNAVYVKKEYNVFAGQYKIDTAYVFLRFFSNGRIFHSRVLESKPSIDDINNLWAGDIGYYIIDEDILFMEIFSPWQGGNYLRNEVDIKGDSLIYYNVRRPNLLTKERYISAVYIKNEVPAGWLVSKPDW